MVNVLKGFWATVGFVVLAAASFSFFHGGFCAGLMIVMAVLSALFTVVAIGAAIRG